MPKRIRVQFAAPDGSNKTNAMVAVQRSLEQVYGVQVTLQHCDPQLDEKLTLTDEELRERLQGTEVIITEMRTAL